MRRATAADLERLAALCTACSAMAQLRERKPGIYYLGRAAFLHFHEDRNRLYADLKRGARFERFEVTTAAQQRALLAMVSDLLSA